MSPEDDGKIGFRTTLFSLIGLIFTFSTLAMRGPSDLLLALMGACMILAFCGHFVLGGGEYRKKMIEEKKKRARK